MLLEVRTSPRQDECVVRCCDIHIRVARDSRTSHAAQIHYHCFRPRRANSPSLPTGVCISVRGPPSVHFLRVRYPDSSTAMRSPMIVVCQCSHVQQKGVAGIRLTMDRYFLYSQIVG